MFVIRERLYAHPVLLQLIYRFFETVNKLQCALKGARISAVSIATLTLKTPN